MEAIMWGARPGRKAADCADEVNLSRGAKSRTSGRNLRSTGTKARTHVDRLRASNTDLEDQLKASSSLLKKVLRCRDGRSEERRVGKEGKVVRWSEDEERRR